MPTKHNKSRGKRRGPPGPRRGRKAGPRTRVSDRKEIREERKLGIPRISMALIPNRSKVLVKSAGFFAEAGATATTLSTCFCNSLLLGGSLSTSGQDLDLAAFGKMYSRYRVLSWRFEIRPVSKSTSITQYSIGMVATGAFTAPSTGSGYFHALRCFPGVYSAVLPPTANFASSRKPVIMRGSLMKYTGVDGLTDQAYAGTSSTSGVFTDPTNTITLFVYCGQQSGSFGASTSPFFDTKWQQEVEFFEKREA